MTQETIHLHWPAFQQSWCEQLIAKEFDEL